MKVLNSMCRLLILCTPLLFLRIQFLLSEPNPPTSYTDVKAAYEKHFHTAVLKRGMPLFRKIALQHPQVSTVNAARTNISVIDQGCKRIVAVMKRAHKLSGPLDEKVKRRVVKQIGGFHAFISGLKNQDSQGISNEASEIPRLHRRQMSAGEGLGKEAQSTLDMLVDSTRRVKDRVVFDEYSRITGRLDNGITAKRKDGKTTRREGHGGEQGESGNGLTMLPDYVYAYLALTRSPDVLVKTIAWMPDSLKGPEQLLDFVDLCSRLEEHDSAIALCEEIVERFYGKDVAAEALQKQAKICVRLKRFDEAVATNQQIIDVYRSDAELVHSQFNLKARYQIIRIYGYELKMYSAAIRECKKLIEAFPDTNAAVYAEYLIGQFLYQNHEYAKGAEAFQRYIEKVKGRGASNLVEAKLLLALSYMGQQKEDDAVAILRNIVAEHPNNKLASKAQFLLGYCFLTRQRYAEAREEFKKLLEKYPGSKYDRQAADYVEKLKGVQLPNPNDQ